MGQFIDYTGNQFGRLHVIRRVVKNKRGYYDCLCECGNTTTVRSDALSGGKTTSCGCVNKERTIETHTRHGDNSSRLYKIHQAIKQRCLNPKNPQFSRYGGRGITMCAEWIESYDSFKQWAYSNGYTDELTIDRIDNDGNYEPSNCRWVNMEVQANNKSSNKLINFRGEVKTLKQWCAELNYGYQSTNRMLREGNKTVEEIFTRKHIGKGFTGTGHTKGGK